MQVELDRKGRVLLPSHVRKKVRARRFELRVERDLTIVMKGLPDPETVRGKYKGLFKGKSMAQIEEQQEKFVQQHRRPSE
jgi:DNA-binding transcriptional regulator/RsmH inhibitor MraZ